MSEEVDQIVYRTAATNPNFWYGNAESFARAARELMRMLPEEQRLPPLKGVATFLQGLAIENQVKAILIALCPHRFVVEDGLTDEFTKHNLQELIRIANGYKRNLIPSKGRRDVIAKLKVAVEWGTYGIPKTVKDYQTATKEGGFLTIAGKGGHPLTAEEWDSCRALCNDLKRILESLSTSPQEHSK